MNDSLRLRKATEADIETLFFWANDKTVRENSFNSQTVNFDEHTAWFHQMMSDPSKVQYILIMNGEPIGQIRLSINEKDAEIGYSISKSFRGLGYGKEIIKLIIKQVKDDYPHVAKLIAKVKPSNVASHYCFDQNNFEETYHQFEFDLSKSGTDESENNHPVEG